MARIHELDMPKLAIATLLGVVGFGIGLMAWLSMPEGTSGLVQGLVWLFVLACITPAFSVYFNWRAGLGLSVVVALGTVIALQLLLKPSALKAARTAPAVQVQTQVAIPTDEVVAEVQPVVMSCVGGLVLRPMMSPNGMKLMLHNPATKQTSILGLLERGNQLRMYNLSPEIRTQLDTCTADDGKGFAAYYTVVQ